MRTGIHFEHMGDHDEKNSLCSLFLCTTVSEVTSGTIVEEYNSHTGTMEKRKTN